MELRLYASVFLVNDNDELLLVRESKKIAGWYTVRV